MRLGTYQICINWSECYHSDRQWGLEHWNMARYLVPRVSSCQTLEKSGGDNPRREALNHSRQSKPRDAVILPIYVQWKCHNPPDKLVTQSHRDPRRELAFACHEHRLLHDLRGSLSRHDVLVTDHRSYKFH
jgi:hypothetical protein